MHLFAADGESALAFSRRALEKIPRHHKRARLYANTYQLGAYQMIGNLETGLSVHQKAMAPYNNRDKNYHAMYLAKLGFIYWVDANLIALRQTAEAILDIIKEHPSPVMVSFGLIYQGITHYHRNELQYAEDNLAKLVKIHYDGPMNFAHGSFALALTYQAQGKPGPAREIVRTVVRDSIETNNANMLQVARAFEAELAFRQGHFPMASRWLEKYHAKPFVPPFRFYMPQLTAVKI
ncbi:MAG: hypothetical protein JRF71_12585 [Deltaproteobacteria bacterium]|nr:hypothetical protein [Deltaproteobacteria bacterium]MBW2201650.1 hypothetical protein [Deltaproteobacteria bacterium]